MKKTVCLIPLDFDKHPADGAVFYSLVKSFKAANDNNFLYDGNIQSAVDKKPDVILFQGSVSVEDLTSLKYLTGAMLIMITGDFRYAPVQSLVDYADIVDLYLLPFSGDFQLRYGMSLNKPCFFIWEAIADSRFMPPKTLMDGKTVFVGNSYDTLPGGENREDMALFLNKHLHNFEAFGEVTGTKGTIPFDDVQKLYNDAYITICENNLSDVEDYFTPRNLTAMSAGSCPLMKYFKGIERWFTDGKDCFYYRHKYELLDIINYLYKNPNKRNEIAEAAHDLATKKYNYDAWVRYFYSKI